MLVPLILHGSAAAWPLFAVFRMGKPRQHANAFDLARLVPAGLMLSDAKLER